MDTTKHGAKLRPFCGSRHALLLGGLGGWLGLQITVAGYSVKTTAEGLLELWDAGKSDDSRIAINIIANNRIAINIIAINRIAINRIAINRIAGKGRVHSESGRVVRRQAERRGDAPFDPR